MKKNILILYDYFTPAFKAGGPIQSLQNLTDYLQDEFQFSIITGAFDKGDNQPLDGIIPDQWNIRDTIRIYYWKPNLVSMPRLFSLFKTSSGEFLYLNGLYSLYYNVFPLLFYKKRIVLAPRGMLHPAALKQKRWKKNIYLFLFKKMCWHKRVTFHATDKEEADYIKTIFGDDVIVKIAPNIPRFFKKKNALLKKSGKLKLVSVALISPMKNIDLVLQSLKFVSAIVEYNIYGPVKDSSYWEYCKRIIKELPDNIKVHYHGEIKPIMVESVISQAHAFILPSKSENFAHAIFESFGCARPVITSNNTPWKELGHHSAGWNVNTEDTAEIERTISQLAAMNQLEYNLFCEGAYNLAVNYLRNQNFKESYRQLFA
ncbi:MAG TPA: glycosyltransferase [Chitinophagaceae bacterium]|nr:glycosyltransferase [Chitinophagaceae bacterium]